MNSFVAIMTRELRERSRLFLLAAALAVLPFVAGLLPAAKSDRTGIIATTSSYLALTLALGSAIVLGTSTIARDLVERRLSFYFSKPVHVDAIWFGKAAASILASLACFAIIAVPTALFVPDWPGPGIWMVDAPDLIGLTVLGVVVLFLVSHIMASMTRSRSPLVGFDFLLWAVAVIALFLLLWVLLQGAAAELLRTLAISIGIALLLILALAPTWQLANGRTDIKRAHAALSRFLWPAVYVVLAIAGVYVLWVVKTDPDDLSRVLHMQQSPRGETVVVAGVARGRGDYHTAFLLEGDGRWQRLPQAPWTDVEFSADGRVRAWIEPVGFLPGREFELYTNDGPTGIRVPGIVSVGLSDDGSRLAVGRGNLVSVYDRASRRLLASAGGFSSGMRHRMFFVSNDVLRVIEISYGRRPAPMRVFELDVPHKKLTKTGEIAEGDNSPFAVSGDGSRLLLRKARRVVDGRTLATIAELPKYEPASSTMLRDGRAVDVVREGNRARLRIHGGGEVLLPVPLASVVGELADGTLIVRGAQRLGWSATGAERTMFLVEPDRGAIKVTVPQVKGPEIASWLDPRVTRYDTTRLAGVDKDGKVVWWDVKTGRTERAQR